MNNETPSMAKVLQDAIDNKLCDLHTAMPAEILEYDAEKQTAKVQPQFKRKFIDGSVESVPTISGVPVIMPRSGKSFISLPLKKGDQVFLIFAERSIENWKQSGGEVDPSTEPRKHSYSDAFAIPGGYHSGNAFAGDPNNIIIKNDKAEITILPSGKFKIGKSGGDELLDLISQVVDALAKTTTNTMIGPQKLNEFATFAQLKGKIDGLKG